MDLDITKTVKKSNLLNEMRNSSASMAVYRLFCVYLAHLRLGSESNVVTFTLADYARIAGLDRPRHADLKAQAESAVGTTATLDNADGGFTVYSLFSDIKLYKNKEDERWMVSVECNPKLAPMIREERGRFLRYKLYNTIALKSYNQQRMYELLKQYEKIGVRNIPLKDLRDYLSIKEHEYPRWADFAQKVLKVAQKALKKSTDICFDFEPIRSSKKGKPVTAVLFTIYRNKEFVDQLHIDEYLPAQEFDYVEAEGFEVMADDATRGTFFKGDLDGQMSVDELEATKPSYTRPVFAMMADIVPEAVHQQRESVLDAIFSTVYAYMPFDVLPDRQAEWVLQHVTAFTRQRWLPDLQDKTERSASAHYRVSLEYWLAERFEETE